MLCVCVLCMVGVVLHRSERLASDGVVAQLSVGGFSFFFLVSGTSFLNCKIMSKMEEKVVIIITTDSLFYRVVLSGCIQCSLSVICIFIPFFFSSSS